MSFLLIVVYLLEFCRCLAYVGLGACVVGSLLVVLFGLFSFDWLLLLNVCFVYDVLLACFCWLF